ncbi:MAG TPA: hypothetical protein PL100_01905 [Bacillota bacterium]|nr:hypothetical protein [Bacillota bacterium]
MTVAVLNKRDRSAAKYFLISGNEYVILVVSLISPNFFNTINSITVGIMRKRTGILGKNFLSSMSGIASITASMRNKSIMEAKKSVACRFLGV